MHLRGLATGSSRIAVIIPERYAFRVRLVSISDIIKPVHAWADANSQQIQPGPPEGTMPDTIQEQPPQVALICGHRYPDTDSIVSALAYEELKNQMGQPAIAVRAGEINIETQHVLNRFGFKAPPPVFDVRMQVRDLDFDQPGTLHADMPLLYAWRMFRDQKLRSLPIVDDDGRLVGLVTAGRTAEFDLRTATDPHLDVNFQNLLLALDAQQLNGPMPERVTGQVRIAGEKMSLTPGLVLLTDRLDRPMLTLAEEKGVACLIWCTGEALPPEDLPKLQRRLANGSHSCILHTPLDLYGAARFIFQATSLADVMQKPPIISFQVTDYLDDVRDQMLNSRFRSYPVVDRDNKAVGTISRFHLLKPRRKRLILVDHNEVAQSISGVSQADVLEIIDHHRLGDVQTDSPIYFRAEPVGCTATIVASMFFENGFSLPKPLAGLMLAAILSDTILFKSPTCTRRDRIIAERLARIADVDADELGRDMFSAAANWGDKTASEMLFHDFKEFLLNHTRIGVGQISSLNSEDLAGKDEALLALMEETRRKRDYDFVLMMETDILREGSRFLWVGENVSIIERAFGPATAAAQKSFLAGVMSRKKQIIPTISAIVG